jgi:hypothetical protein
MLVKINYLIEHKTQIMIVTRQANNYSLQAIKRLKYRSIC